MGSSQKDFPAHLMPAVRSCAPVQPPKPDPPALDQLRLGLHGRIARPMRGKDFDQASERGFAVFRVLKLKAKLGGFIADKMGKRERHFLRAHVSDGAVSSAHDVAATAAAACDADFGMESS